MTNENVLVRWRICWILLTIGFTLWLSNLRAQAQPATFFVVRHADRLDVGDGLTEDGKQRALHLRDLLVHLRIAAIYSTNTNRTLQTAQPTAAAARQGIRRYDELSPLLFRRWKEDHLGQSVLIVGHSNTVEPIIHGLGARGDFSVGNEYDNLFVVSVSSTGTKAIRLRYGKSRDEPPAAAAATAAGDVLTRLAAREAQQDYHFYRIDYRTLSSRRLVEMSGLDVLQKNPGRRSLLVRATGERIDRWRREGLPADIVIRRQDDLDQAFRAEDAAFAARLETDENPAGLYHTYAEVKSVLEGLAENNPRARVVDIGDSVLGKDILALEVGTGTAEFVVVGCHHAREWISVEVPLELARYLTTSAIQGAESERVTQLLQQCRLTIIPMLNPDGHDVSVRLQRLWRKNASDNGDGTFGVDLNRNYSVNWGGPGSSGYSSDQTYRGPNAFSEPESQVFRDLVQSRAQGDLRGVLSYHSYSQLVLHPWGSMTGTSDPHEQAQRANLSQVAKLYADEVYAVHGEEYEPQQAIELYQASGITGDWVWETFQYNVPTLTIELRPAAFIGTPGFRLPESLIEPTWQENRPAILAVLEKWLEPELASARVRVRRDTLEVLRAQRARLRKELDRLDDRINALHRATIPGAPPQQ